MMYTFGDVRTPIPASAQLLEQIVRKQLVDIVSPPNADPVLQLLPPHHRTDHQCHLHCHEREELPKPVG